MRKQTIFIVAAIAAAVVLVAGGIGYAMSGKGHTTTHVHHAVAASPAPTNTVTTTPTAPPVRVQINNNATPAPAAPAPAAPSDPGFLNPSTLATSMANENANVLDNAPSYDYSGSDAQVNVECTPSGGDTFSCSATDGDGDYSAWNDTVTVAPDGSSWSDQGMNWSGPDIYVDGGVTNYWTVPAVTDWTAS